MKIYIDGENFRHGIVNILKDTGDIKESRDLEKFPLRKLLEDTLASKELEIVYYSSNIKLPHGFTPSQMILDRASTIRDFNRKWIAQLTAQQIEHIKAGHLKVKTTEPCLHCRQTQEILQEKGVDVRIAVDIVSDSHSDGHESIGLMSSDSDLIPALDRIKKLAQKLLIYALGVPLIWQSAQRPTRQ